ncbi:LuxR C-terminal-related transcriptional regulator [Vibrio sp. FNV 38]|nr:LuxR C-terminal-related transcriptional regulator [Vibrio sp. FNV 38]
MTQKIYTRTLYFLCEDLDDTQLHINRLDNKLDTKIFRITPETLCDDKPIHKNKVLIIDYTSRHLFLHQLVFLSVDINEFDTVLINVTHRLTTDELIQYGNLKGLFYKGESTEDIMHGLNNVVDGKNCLPRKIMSQLLHYFRSTIGHPKPAAAVCLTDRELQILRNLRFGTSNNKIAKDLFISELTVKSHLHHIFRKLSVKNRSQAIAWAEHHLLP